MQLMPFTARRLVRNAGLEIKDSSDLNDFKINITVGAFYLKELIKEFTTIPMAIAAYNAGEERVKEWLNKGRYRSIDEFIEYIPYKETRNYVKRVLTTYVNYYLCYTKKRANRKNEVLLNEKNDEIERLKSEKITVKGQIEDLLREIESLEIG